MNSFSRFLLQGGDEGVGTSIDQQTPPVHEDHLSQTRSTTSSSTWELYTIALPSRASVWMSAFESHRRIPHRVRRAVRRRTPPVGCATGRR